jgi:hypothetical protein
MTFDDSFGSLTSIMGPDKSVSVTIATKNVLRLFFGVILTVSYRCVATIVVRNKFAVRK